MKQMTKQYIKLSFQLPSNINGYLFTVVQNMRLKHTITSPQHNVTGIQGEAVVSLLASPLVGQASHLG